MFSAAQGTVDLSTGSPATLRAASSITGGPHGPAMNFDGTSSTKLEFNSGNSRYNLLGDITVLYGGTPTDFSTYRTIVSKQGAASGTTNIPFELFFNATSGVPALLRANATTDNYYDINPTGAIAGAYNTFGLSQKGGIQVTPVMVLNGAIPSVTTISATQTGAATGNSDALRVGQRVDGGTIAKGSVNFVIVLNKALTAPQMLALLADPYQLLEPVRSPVGGNKNITVALTGQAMTAGQGALATTASKALTGQAATAGQGSVTTAAAAYTGYTFRRSLAGGSGFPGDPANTTWADINQIYSPSISGGNGVGFNYGPGLNSNNFNSPVNGYYGGDWENNSSDETWRVDVPNGPIDVLLLLGDSNAIRLRYGLGSTVGTDYSDIQGGSAGTYPKATDAHGVVFTDANAWLASNTALRVANTASYLQVERNHAATFNAIAYLAYRIVPTALVDCTFTDETGAAGAPTLFQNQVSGKLVGTIQQSIGGSPVTSLGVFESDGTTPSLYLQIRYIGAVPWLAHKAVQMPALSGTYNFKIIQTDISGQAIYSNSPYAQSCAWTVTPASTKPYNDGTFNSKLSTGTFLAAKKVRDVFNQTYNPTTRVGEWLGYVSGAFDFSATVYNITALRNQLISYAATAQGVSNKQFLIEIDTDGTSDWTTHAMSIRSTDFGGGVSGFSICPENGNICLVRYKASGAKPVLYGGWQIKDYIRGLHIDGLTFGIGIAALSDPVVGGTMSNAILWGYDGENTLHLPIIRITNCDFGVLFNPSYSGGRTAATIDSTQLLYGVACASNGQVMEQFIMKGCRFWGIHDGIGPFGARMIHVSNCDFALQNDDVIITMCIPNEAGAYFPNFEEYQWFDNCHMRDVIAASDGLTHADYQQQRTLDRGTHPANGMIYRLWENSSALINFTDSSMQRNLMILSDTAPVSGCWINNIFAHNALRGIDGGMGATSKSWAEYNSLGPPNINGAGMTIQDQEIYDAYGAPIVIRNNIMGGGAYTDTYGYQGNVGYNATIGGIDPNTAMVGPFGVASDNASRWAAPLIHEAVPTYDITAYFANMVSVFTSKTGADAGYQGILTLAGLAMTAGQGALARSVAIALSGQAMTSGQGTLARTVAKVLSGQAATSQIGAVALSASWAMPGQAMTAAPGAPALSVAKILSGQAATSQTGAVALSVLLAISGQEASTRLGTVTGTGGDFVAAAGEEVMLVPLEDRMMFVPVEERTMAVTK